MGDELKMLITCAGGDVFQGDRIYRSILEHEGPTTAVVIGCAASMAAAMLSAFDKVEIDSGAEIMLHKAHVEGVDTADLSDEEKGIIERFNQKTYSRMKEGGVSDCFLSEVFLSEKDKDFWISPEQAQELGIGTVVGIDKKEHRRNFRVAASLDLYKIKNRNQMNLFKKAIPRTIALEDGRIAIFESKHEELKKGDVLVLANADGKLKGEIKFKTKDATVVAKVDEDGMVEDLCEEEPKAVSNITQEEFDMLKEEVMALKEMMGKMYEKGAEMQNGMGEEYEKKMEAATDLLNKAVEAVSTIKSAYVPPKINDKGVAQAKKDFSDMTNSETAAMEMRNFVKQVNNSK